MIDNNAVGLVADASKVDSQFLLHFLKTVNFYRLADKTSVPSIRKSTIGRISIPLPSLEEQRRIAAILDQAEALRSKRRQALAKLDTLTQSLFLEMFGDPAQNSHGLQVEKLSALALQVTDGEHLTPRRSEFGIKLLSARNIRDGFISTDDVDYVDREEFQRISKRCSPVHGDILISCSGTIGRVASVCGDEPLCLVRSVAFVRADPKSVNPKYLELYLRTKEMNRRMKAVANSSSQANLFQNQIRSLLVLLPSRESQDAFVTLTRHIDDSRNHARKHLDNLDTLFASLQHRAFHGEL